MIKKINNNWYSNLISIINFSHILRVDYIFIKYVKKILPILNLLVKLNYINNYKILNDNTMIIYLNFKNNRIKWNIIKNYYKTSQHYYLNVYFLKKFHINDFNKILILETSKGIITHHQAIKFNIGGILIFYLN